jgi:S1-C subfamily serine protease
MLLNKKIPRINFRLQETGTSIFTLGYPLIDKMGEEIKLTTGVVSSTSGYDGDNTTYQVSTPIQPGNSGGPLFNDKGEIVGIINAKLKGAENASYAIKISYLSILLSELGINVNDPTNAYQDISKLALSEKVKLLKNNIFILETE